MDKAISDYRFKFPNADPQRTLQFSGVGNLRAFQLVVAFSVLVRLVALWVVRHAPLSSDAQRYCEMAAQLASGKPFVPYWPPGLPLYLEPFVALGANLLVLRASMLVFWLICCWGLYRLMRAMELQGIAWLVLLVFSLLPDAIQMSIEPLTQMPVAALLVVSLSCAVKTLRDASKSGYVLMGSALGLMSLIRPSAIPLVILIPLFCALVVKRYLSSVISVSIGLVLVLCWMAHAKELTGRWMINTANTVNLYYGNNRWTPLYRTWYFGSHAKAGSPEAGQFPEFEQILHRTVSLPELERPAVFQSMAVNYIRERPGLFLVRTLNRVRCYFGFDIFTSAALARESVMGLRVFPLVLVWSAMIYLLIATPSVYWIFGAPGLFWRRSESLILMGTVIVYAAPYWISMSHPTYHFPVLLPLAVLGASAWKVQDARISRRWAAWAAVVGLGLIQVEWVWQMSRSALAQTR